MQGEKIAALGWPGTLSGGGRTIDARGKIVVPGSIEPHALAIAMTHSAETGPRSGLPMTELLE